MSKVAFLFPGQGSQYVGMGADFYENSEVAKDIFDLASNVTGIDVKKLCFEENEEINVTEYTQLAMLADEVAILMAIKEAGLDCDVTAGLSLGEYGALVASGVLTPSDAFWLIRQRGMFMQEAYPVGGGMSAVLGADNSLIENICNEVANEAKKVVSIANYNCPGQIVITGHIDAVTEAGRRLTEAGAKRVIPLKVSGPFHSELLKSASDNLAKVLDKVSLKNINVPYITNVTADYVSNLSEVPSLLQKQVCSSVRWQQTIERMIADGVDTFIEIGPGKTLTGFMKKINKEVKVLNVDKYEDLAKLLEANVRE